MTNNIDKQSFGEAGCAFFNGTTASLPEGQFCAVSFVTETSITTALTSAEAPLITGTQTGIPFPAGFTLFTPINITGTSTGKMTGKAVFYRAI